MSVRCGERAPARRMPFGGAAGCRAAGCAALLRPRRSGFAARSAAAPGRRVVRRPSGCAAKRKSPRQETVPAGVKSSGGGPADGGFRPAAAHAVPPGAAPVPTAAYCRMQRIEWPYSTVWMVFDQLLFVVWTMLAELSVMRT